MIGITELFESFSCIVLVMNAKSSERAEQDEVWRGHGAMMFGSAFLRQSKPRYMFKRTRYERVPFWEEVEAVGTAMAVFERHTSEVPSFAARNKCVLF